MSAQKVLIEVIGWAGVAAIVGGYALISFGVLDPSQLSYQLLNLSGAIGIIISSLSKKDYQPVVLNVIWIVVAVTAIFTVIL